MWLLASAVGVLILGQAFRGFFEVYPFESSLKVTDLTYNVFLSSYGNNILRRNCGDRDTKSC